MDCQVGGGPRPTTGSPTDGPRFAPQARNGLEWQPVEPATQGGGVDRRNPLRTPWDKGVEHAGFCQWLRSGVRRGFGSGFRWALRWARLKADGPKDQPPHPTARPPSGPEAPRASRAKRRHRFDARTKSRSLSRQPGGVLSLPTTWAPRWRAMLTRTRLSGVGVLDHVALAEGCRARTPLFQPETVAQIETRPRRRRARNARVFCCFAAGSVIARSRSNKSNGLWRRDPHSRSRTFGTRLRCRSSEKLHARTQARLVSDSPRRRRLDGRCRGCRRHRRRRR